MMRGSNRIGSRTASLAALLVAAVVAVGVASTACADVVEDLKTGNSYAGNPPLNYTYHGGYAGGGGSIDVSRLNGSVLPFVYCTDLADNLRISHDYPYTLIDTEGRQWWGTANNPISGFVTVPNAGSVAYLVSTFGMAASAAGNSAEAGLQAAIWEVIYHGFTYADSHGSHPLFNYVGGTSADSYYNTYLTAVTNGHPGDSTQWKTAPLSSVLWLSPSTDALISSTHAPSTIYQGLVTVAPEPSSLAVAGLGALAIAAAMLRRGPRAGA